MHPHDSELSGSSRSMSDVAEILTTMLRKTRVHSDCAQHGDNFPAYRDAMRAGAAALATYCTTEHLQEDQLTPLTFCIALIHYGILLLETGQRQAGMEVIMVHATNALRELS